MHFKKLVFICIGILFCLGVVLAATTLFKNEDEGISFITPFSNTENEGGIIGSPASPSPFSFQELTIPYLQNRQYKSQLQPLQQVAENAAYTSYLTSYDSDTLRINAQLTKPKGEMPNGGWPAIIFVHGYIPPQQYQTLVNYASYVDYLARRGFAIFKIDLRGHAKSEGESSGAYYSGDYVIDVLSAHAALAGSDFINPNAIGLWGHSMAGNVTFRALAAQGTIPAIVIWAGAVYSYEDMQAYGIQDGSYQPPPANSERQRKRQLLRETHGDFDVKSAFWKQVVPTNYLGNIKGAVQINHAVDDPVVSIEYSRNLMKLLDATSVVHELNEYPSGGHNISGASFTKAMENTVSFFQKYLK